MARKLKAQLKTVDGEDVYVRGLNGGAITTQVIELLQKVGVDPGCLPELGALLVLSCECDQFGVLVHTEEGALEKIKEETSLSFLKDFTGVALDVSGLGDDAEEVRKNS